LSILRPCALAAVVGSNAGPRNQKLHIFSSPPLFVKPRRHILVDAATETFHIDRPSSRLPFESTKLPCLTLISLPTHKDLLQSDNKVSCYDTSSVCNEPLDTSLGNSPDRGLLQRLGIASVIGFAFLLCFISTCRLLHP
jgi:hypothetical protein